MSSAVQRIQRCDGAEAVPAPGGADDAGLWPCTRTTTDWWALFADNWRELFGEWVYAPRGDRAMCPEHAAINARRLREWDEYFQSQPGTATPDAEDLPVIPTPDPEPLQNDPVPADAAPTAP